MDQKGSPSSSSSGVDKNKERMNRLNKLHMLRTAGNNILI